MSRGTDVLTVAALGVGLTAVSPLDPPLLIWNASASVPVGLYVVERPIGPQQEIVQTRGLRLRSHALDMRTDFAAVLSARVVGRGFDGFAGFHVDQERWAAEVRIELLRIKDVKEHDFVAAKAQGFNGFDNGIRAFEEI